MTKTKKENAKKAKNGATYTPERNEYEKRHWDYFHVRMKKGRREAVEQRASEENVSMNKYIVTLVDKDLKKHKLIDK